MLHLPREGMLEFVRAIREHRGRRGQRALGWGRAFTGGRRLQSGPRRADSGGQRGVACNQVRVPRPAVCIEGACAAKIEQGQEAGVDSAVWERTVAEPRNRLAHTTNERRMGLRARSVSAYATAAEPCGEAHPVAN